MVERSRSPITVFLLSCALAVVAIAVAFTRAKLRSAQSSEDAETSEHTPTLRASGLSSPAQIFYRHTGLGPHYGNLATVIFDGDAAATTYIDDLSCEAVYVAAGRGICLSANRGVITTYSAKLFDAAAYIVSTELALPGVPSRTRVSADGTLGATTVFVTGHGYDSVDFSTQTLLLDLRSGAVIADLETFEVLEDGALMSSADFNFWGVTFTPDSALFYATLSTAGRHLLVRGSIADRKVEVLRENVECPSLSPDGTRIAYKRRFEVDGRIGWQLHVLELATMRDTALAERRSVDDQLEWLDERRVLYSIASGGSGSAATDVWVAAADGNGIPQLFLRNAYSPAVTR